jgi:hypothetical protein
VWFGEFVLRGSGMSTLGLIEYQDASAEVRAVYEDILAVRKTDWINNFWNPARRACDSGLCGILSTQSLLLNRSVWFCSDLNR